MNEQAIFHLGHADMFTFAAFACNQTMVLTSYRTNVQLRTGPPRADPPEHRIQNELPGSTNLRLSVPRLGRLTQLHARRTLVPRH